VECGGLPPLGPGKLACPGFGGLLRETGGKPPSPERRQARALHMRKGGKLNLKKEGKRE